VFENPLLGLAHGAGLSSQKTSCWHKVVVVVSPLYMRLSL